MTHSTHPAARRSLALLSVAIATIAVLVAGCSSGSVTAIDNDELRRLVSEGALLVDVRTPAEYASGHIEGAVLVPPADIESASSSWDDADPVVVYCATGARSATAAQQLAESGFTVYDLTSGVSGWDGELVQGEIVDPTTDGGEEIASDMPVMLEFLTDS